MVKLVWFHFISHISEGIVVSTENQQVTEIGVGQGEGRLEFQSERLQVVIKWYSTSWY